MTVWKSEHACEVTYGIAEKGGFSYCQTVERMLNWEMETVAQLVEHWIVAPEVAGSNPVRLPILACMARHVCSIVQWQDPGFWCRLSRFESSWSSQECGQDNRQTKKRNGLYA